jgi:hypothetical protein
MTRDTIRKLVAHSACLLLGLGSFGIAFAFEPMQASDQNPAIVAARVKEVMHRFGLAVKQKDMLAFHGSVVMSATLAEQYPAEKMNAAFKPLIDSGVDLTKLDAMQPVLDAKPEVDALNQLIVKGHYASAPPTLFEMRFIREGKRIGLSYIDVHLSGRPVSSAATTAALNRANAMPDAATMAALTSKAPPAPSALLSARELSAVRTGMHAFAVAAKARDMSQFLNADIVARAWRERQTPAQLNAAYRNTIALGGDFTLLDSKTPVIPNAPTQGENGVLDISGYYLAPDTRIGFRMGFINEEGALRLVNFVIVPKHPR